MTPIDQKSLPLKYKRRAFGVISVCVLDTTNIVLCYVLPYYHDDYQPTQGGAASLSGDYALLGK